MAFGGLVDAAKTLVVRFRSDGWELVKAEIDDIPDEKTVKIEYDRSGFSAAMQDLASLGRSMDSLERSLGGGSGGGGGGRGFLDKLLFGGFSGIGPLPAFFTSVPGLAVLAGAIGAATVEVDALATGFAAAGQGVVAFGALAYPTITGIMTGVSTIATDTAAYQSATTAAAKSTDLAKIKADWAALDPVQKTAVKNIQKLQSMLDTLAQQFEPLLAPILNTVLGKGGIIFQILQDLPAFAGPAAKAIEGLLTQFNNFLKSPGAAAFQKTMQGIEGPAITAIGQGVGKVATAIGKLLTIFGPRDVVKAIQIFFDTISVAIRFLGNSIDFVRRVWDNVWPRLKSNWDELSRGMSHAFDNVKHAWDNVSHAIDNFNHAVSNVLHAFDNIGHAIGNVVHAFDNVNHAIDNVRHFFFVMGSDIGHVMGTIQSTLARWVTDVENDVSKVGSWFSRLPGMILRAVGNLGSLLVNAGRSLISGLIAGINSMIGPLSSALSFITHLIPSWKGPLDKDRQLLFPSGQAIMGGLMAGIGSQVPALHGQLTGITTGISGHVRGVGVGLGGGITVNVTVSPGTSPNETARQIQKMLLQLKRNNGNAALGLA